jgi:hypothetical protein
MSDTDITADVADPPADSLGEVRDYIDGIDKLTSLSEAAAILADAETALDAIEPIAGVFTVLSMALNVFHDLELPERTCAYQGLCYGLMYAALGMGDPQPNPGWPSREDAPEGDARFAEGLAEAKERLNSGQDGTKCNNFLLLAIAKSGEKAVINALWQRAVTDEDHLLRMFTLEWPNVGPNG